ncbi:EAL domain-containing protein [Pseudomonas fluorescens BBc6R8]|uniref:EAL domain-containing response regulator n=1 Tax=Pseudomonas fluorescens TaxID=294 RepID=UPI000281CF9A|nr:EAL domain-containing protein [Pseudomonas fluorescens]QQD56473.1 EAL domain-containing protein [Pseudomonas fluorescens BBc6R8]
MNSIVACGPCELERLHVIVVESDIPRAARLLSILRSLGIHHLSVVSGLQDLSLQLSQTQVDVLVTEIRATSNDGLMLPSALKQHYGSACSLQAPRILWLADAEPLLPFTALAEHHAGATSVRGQGISIKALDAHAQLACAAGFVATTLYSFSAKAMSDALHGLFAMSKIAHRPLPARNDVPSEDDVIIALATGEGLRVVFQPQHDLRTGEIVAAEALVRWRHPEHGDISPVVLIPLVNKLGLHLLLFSFVKARVLEVLCSLQSMRLEIPISVNASVDTLCTTGFSARLADRMMRAGLPNHLLKIELTEDIPVMDELCLSAAINALKVRGFGVSLDDFGSGSATLRQIASMPFDEVKIDGALIRDLDNKSTARRVIATTLALARRLNMTVVAEGIETDSCRILLRRLGCTNGQGFVLSRPMEVQDFLSRLTMEKHASARLLPLSPAPGAQRNT